MGQSRSTSREAEEDIDDFQKKHFTKRESSQTLSSPPLSPSSSNSGLSSSKQELLLRVVFKSLQSFTERELQERVVDVSRVKSVLFDTYSGIHFPAHLNVLTSLEELTFRMCDELVVNDVDLSQLNASLRLFVIDECEGVNLGELTSLPFDNLETLEIKSCDIEELNGSVLSNLSQLKHLSLQDNLLKRLPSNELLALKSLKTLHLGNNKIKQIPPEIGQLVSLKELILNGNKLEMLPSEIGNLLNLKELDVTDNKLKSIPDSIGRLAALTELDLNNNKLTELPDTLGNIIALEELDISENNITVLPTTLSRLSNLKYIRCDTDQFTSPPPYVIESGVNAVLGYLGQVHKTGQMSYKRTKLVVLGNGGEGKTLLLRAIKHRPLGTPILETGTEVTEGVVIEDITIHGKESDSDPIILTAHDFAGQTVYQSYQQFYMTENAVYIVCYNLRHGMSGIDGWLHAIKIRAPNSAVFVVGTNADQYERDDIPSKFQQMFPRIHSYHSVSSSTGQGITELCHSIYNVLHADPHYQNLMATLVPLSYVKLIDTVHELSTSTFDMTWKELYARSGFDNISAFEQAIYLLDDWGTIMQFKQRRHQTRKNVNKTLDDLIILNPQWISDVMTILITSANDNTVTGVVSDEFMEKIWANVCKTRSIDQKKLLFILRNFECAYRFGIRSTLIPCLLPSLPPLNFDLDQEMYRIEYRDASQPMVVEISYQFEHIPDDFFARFLVRMNKCAVIKQAWRSGTLLEKSGNKLSVSVDYQKSLFKCMISGVYPQNFLTICQETIKQLIQEYYNLNVQQFVTCPNCVVTKQEQGGIFPIEKLMQDLKQRQYRSECYHCDHSFYINELLVSDSQTEVIQNAIAKFKVTNNQEMPIEKKEFLHRQFIAQAHERFKQNTFSANLQRGESFFGLHSETMRHNILLLPVIIQDQYVAFSLCEMPGRFHFVDDAIYTMNAERFVYHKDQLTHVQQHLKSMLQILEATGIPDGFERVVRTKYPTLTWDDMITSALEISELTFHSNAVPDDDTDPNRRNSWFEDVFGKVNSDNMSFVHVPACKKPLYLCSEHQKWFNNTEEQRELSTYDLSDESVQIESYIAKGAFGRVYLAKIHNVIECAVKSINLSVGCLEDDINYDLLKLSQKEMKVLRKLSHPNIVLYLGSYLGKHRTLCICMEYVGNGSLAKHLKSEMSRSTKRKIALGIAMGMNYLSSHGVIHQDLKPDNVLLDDAMTPKIADFGTTKILDVSNTLMTATLGTSKENGGLSGTIPYMAPEALLMQKVTQAVDVYAYGIVLFELYAQQQAWKGLSPFLIPQKVISGERPIQYVKEQVTEIPSFILSLMRRCWKAEATDRPTFAEIVEEMSNWND